MIIEAKNKLIIAYVFCIVHIILVLSKNDNKTTINQIIKAKKYIISIGSFLYKIVYILKGIETIGNNISLIVSILEENTTIKKKKNDDIIKNDVIKLLSIPMIFFKKLHNFIIIISSYLNSYKESQYLETFSFAVS
jgi:hypothetical protein